MPNQISLIGKNVSLEELIKINKNKSQSKTAGLVQNWVFVLDCSGSMEGVLPTGESAIQVLQDTVQSLNLPMELCVMFSDEVQIGKYFESYRMGGTGLDRAFKFVGKHFPKKQVCLVSDGCPDDSVAALREGLALKVPIHIIYIGEKGTHGEKFMEELALKSKGTSITTDISVELIEQKIIFLLEGKK